MTAERWHTMPTQMLLEQACTLAERQRGSEAAHCIQALTWRLKGSEEWIESLNRRATTKALDAAGLDEALRSYGRRLDKMTTGDAAAHFFNTLLEVLCEAGLIRPSSRVALATSFVTQRKDSQ